MKRLSFIIGAFLLALLVVSCGSSSYTTTGSGSGSTPASGDTPAAASGSEVLIHTTTATVDGKSETILTNTQGMTLYYFTPDTATQAACAGSCIGKWPPLLSTGASTVTSSTTLPGKLSVVTTANGTQVEYNGHPLYTYVQDTAAGQTTGQNVGGKWFVAADTLTLQGGKTGGSGYGY